MMRAESDLVHTPIVLGRFTVFSVILALIPSKNNTFIIMARKESTVFEDEPIMVIASHDMILWKNSLINIRPT
jgi:hypothetical protein